MAWFEFEEEEWEQLNKLSLVVALVWVALLLLTRPLVWKADASKLAMVVFVLLAVACVRWFFRWPAGEKQSLSSGGQFRGRMSSVMWGVLLAGVLTQVVVNGVVLASLLPMEPMVRQAKLLDTRGSRNGFNTWVLELEDGTRFDVEYAFLRSVPKSLVGQTVRIKIQENRLGYYVRPE